MSARGWRESLQLDALYAVLREVKTGALSEDEAITRLERSPAWVWTAMDSDSKLLLVIDVGTRTLAMAPRVVHRVTQALAPDCVPLFLTDGLKECATALRTMGRCSPHAVRPREQLPSRVGCRCPRCSTRRW